MKTGHILLDVASTALTAEDKEILQHPAVAGVILFARNYEDPKQLSTLTRAIRSANRNIVIAVDQEGGRVQRFINGFTRLPPLRHWGERYQQNPSAALQELAAITAQMAQELHSHGVNICLAPVLDVDHGVSQVIGDRSFSANSEVVTQLGRCVIETMHKSRVLAVGKHFPGHGGVEADSHTSLPIDQRERKALDQSDLIPFQRLIQSLRAIMPSHVIYEKLDSKPAVFSRYWLRDVLRQQFNFKGLIISDDITMAAAATMGSYAERAMLALEAGCDWIAVCNNREGSIAVLHELENFKDAEASARIQFHLEKMV